jgi:hypothetical protein
MPKVFVIYNGRTLGHEIEIDTPLDALVTQLCNVFQTSGVPAQYMLGIATSNVVLKQEVLVGFNTRSIYLLSRL